jgi:phosphate transport system substrate-binding protein
MKRAVVAVLMMTALASTAWSQRLEGAGATFPYLMYTKWFSEYAGSHSGVAIHYQPIGSGEGIRKVTAGVVDFGATDVPLTDIQLARARVRVIQVPVLMGAVVPIFNLPDVGDLKFSGSVLADIYLGKITNWDDARIAKDNAGVRLPDRKIFVVHRADVSGTSYIFTDYLSKVSRAWLDGPGRSSAPSWPVGAGAMRNEGVAALVSKQPGAIGYVELTYALKNHISSGAVENRAGKWIRASIESIEQAAASNKEIPSDYRVSITNGAAPDAYPISSFTWLLIPVHGRDEAKAKLIKNLVSWIVTSGQSQAASLSYAPLPQPVAEQVLKSVTSLQ